MDLHIGKNHLINSFIINDREISRNTKTKGLNIKRFAIEKKCFNLNDLSLLFDSDVDALLQKVRKN